MDADRHTSANMMLEQLNELSSPTYHNSRMTPNTQTTQDTSNSLLFGSKVNKSNRQPLIGGNNNNSNLQISQQHSNRRNPLVQSTKNSRQSQNSTNHFKGQATTLKQRRGSQDQ